MDRDFHIWKARRNEVFHESIDLDKHGEWAAVALFYAAMHYVDAVLAEELGLPAEARHPGDHAHRNQMVAASHSLSPIWLFYRSLYHRSRQARYTSLSLPRNVLANLQPLCFEPLRRHTGKLPGLPD
ncbi:MAG: hypothetical protein HY673_21455 [Chloroflexi bacterium]|nr:hypothetical protein [Chloroflexota bacterium]